MKKRIFYNLTIAIFLGLFANGIWLYEIIKVIGWKGLDWLAHEHVSIFIINAVVVIAYLFPFWQNKHIRENKTSTLTAFISLYCCTLLGYYAVKTILFNYAFFVGQAVTYPIAAAIILSLPFLIYWISHKLIHKIKVVFVFLLTLGFLTTLIVSNYTLDIIHGFGNATDIIDAIKMGYPYFWITIIMNGIGMFTEQKLLQTDQKEWLIDNDDILDA